ncbi:unnamed protein product [Sphagnum troendelagicum]|uniref:Agenet domain-containing protein n=1 Tax=Sphagnum troendelagicum TaxID=128251 RepID=A0ABP0TVZ2_9BRYO
MSAYPMSNVWDICQQNACDRMADGFIREDYDMLPEPSHGQRASEQPAHVNETEVEELLHEMESNELEGINGDDNRLLLQESLQSGNEDSTLISKAASLDLCNVQAGNGLEMLGNKVVSEDADNGTVEKSATEQDPLERGQEQDQKLVDEIPPILTNRCDKGSAQAPILSADLPETLPAVETLLDVPASADVSVAGVLSGLVQPGLLPDPCADGKCSSVPSSVPLLNEMLQAQMQSQILVLGALSKGLVPDETVMLTAGAGTGVSMVGGISHSGVLPSNLKVSSESVAHRGLGTTADTPSGERFVSETVAAFSSRYQNAPSEARAELRVVMDKHLQQAQATAQEAVASATSALAQSHVVWTRMQSLKPSELGADLEAQIASVAATVAAAASVAKAAVEVATAISEAWKKGFTQVNAAHGEAFLRVSTIGGGLGQSDVAFRITQPIEVQPMQASNVDRLGKSGADHMDGEMNETAKFPVPKKGKSSKSKSVQDSLPMNGTPNKQNDQGDMLCEKKVSKEAPRKKRLSLKGKEVEPGILGDAAKRFLKKQGKVGAEKSSSSSFLEMAGAAQRSNSKELGGGGNMMNIPETITVGSLVEVMSEEEGLRGGWFSGKVLMLTEEAALVAYDELLNDDGCSNLKEWFPRKESQGVTGPQRQMRPMHPISSVRETGSRKRRLPSGCQVWVVGDHVDAFIQDGWWEGVVREVNDVENKVTVYFPGEQDLVVVKPRILRPSLNWTEGKWRPCTDVPAEEELHPVKQQKVGSLSSEEGKQILPPSHSTHEGSET